jgi:hypothetical protein
MSGAVCETCPFWAQYPDPDGAIVLGDCRRRAPTMMAVRPEDPRDTADFHSLFPYTSSDEWCGEHPGRQTQVPAA